jgi:hypothetical protein
MDVVIGLEMRSAFRVGMLIPVADYVDEYILFDSDDVMSDADHAFLLSLGIDDGVRK